MFNLRCCRTGPTRRPKTVEGDQELLQAAIEGIARLNRRHGQAPGGDRFLLLHRRRVWNESQRRWIGWERKRGKLHELNQLLRGASDTTFLALMAVRPMFRRACATSSLWTRTPDFGVILSGA